MLVRCVVCDGTTSISYQGWAKAINFHSTRTDLPYANLQLYLYFKKNDITFSYMKRCMTMNFIYLFSVEQQSLIQYTLHDTIVHYSNSAVTSCCCRII